MDVGNLQRRYVDFVSSLFDEGFLDSQYTQLQQLQDESNPDFVLEVVTLFFTDAEKIINELSRILDQQVVDFKKVDALVHQLKGSSASIGAQRVKNVCVDVRNYFLEGNRDGCLVYLQQVKQEYVLVKSKLETLFRMEQQILAAGGSVPLMSFFLWPTLVETYLMQWLQPNSKVYHLTLSPPPSMLEPHLNNNNVFIPFDESSAYTCQAKEEKLFIWPSKGQ